MGSVSEDEDGVEEWNLSEMKRSNVETEGVDLRSKKPRISESIDETVGVLGEIGGREKEIIENGAMGFIDLNQSGKEVSCGAEYNSCDDKKMDFDLNVALFDAENNGLKVADRRVEIIDIPSDDESENELETIDAKDVTGNGEEIEKETAYELLKLGSMENFGGSSSVSGARKYTKEEKGKAKVHDSWLSLSTTPFQFELQPGRHDFIEFRQPSDNSHHSGYLDSSPEHEQRFEEFNVQRDNYGEELDLLNDEPQREYYNTPAELRRRSRSPTETIQELRLRRLEILERAREFELRQLLESGRRFARSENYVEASSNQEKPHLEDDKLLGKSPGPFSLALKMVRERKAKGPELLFNWKSSCKGCNASRTVAPSLLDLSLKVLAMNPEAVVSLEHVPDILRHRLTDSLCNLRKMNIHTIELLVKGSPTEIRIKDCSWLTEEYFFNTFGNFDAKNLMVLQLDLCGQCMLDYLLSKTLARFSKSLPKLGILSLKGAARLSDNGLKPLVSSAPALQSINLSQCSLLTHAGINILATSLGSILKELYIDDCQKIEAMLVLPALKKFEHLEVLSVAGIQTVSDQFVHGLITTCGQKLKELDLAGCQGLTNYSLKVIGDASTNLHSLNISNLDEVTDLGLQFLADGCRSIQTLKLCRNKFSDEAVAAFLEASGETLKELSLNNVTLVGPCTAFSLAKCSRKLLSLDLSWCRKITNEALGLIVDSCLSLKLVKLFGCTQITNVFLDGHSNPVVRVIGLKLTPILECINIVEPQGVLLRYSPLASFSDSGSDNDQYA